MSEPSWVPLGGSPASAAWTTGDTKVSMQAASHDDPAGGRWLLADGSAIPAQYTSLIALAGPNLPDAKGRTLVMLGTNTDVDALGKSDGVAVASRSPKHKHKYGTQAGAFAGGSYGSPYEIGGAAAAYDTSPRTSALLDTPAYVVVGNLFVHT
jgi:hypothetical protein